MKRTGFTLLELIIIIVIIGILATFAIPRYNTVSERARSAEGVSILGSMRSAQIRYRAEHGNWATTATDLDVDFGTPRFFSALTADDADGSVCATPTNDAIACVTRDFTNAGNPIDNTEAYILNINENGDVTCENGTNTCPALGY